MNENLKRNVKGLAAALVTFFGLMLGAKWGFFILSLIHI